MKNKIIALFLAASICIVPLPAEAATSDDMKAEAESILQDLEQSRQNESELLDKQKELWDHKKELEDELNELSQASEELYSQLGNVLRSGGLGGIITSIASESTFMQTASALTGGGSVQKMLKRSEEYDARIGEIQDELDETLSLLSDNSDLIIEERTSQTSLVKEYNAASEEYEAALSEEAEEAEQAAEEEAARIAAEEEEAARIAAEEEAAREAEEEAERQRAEEEASAQAAAQAEEQAAAQQYDESYSESSSASGDGALQPEDYPSSYTYGTSGGEMTRSKGVVYFNGHKETWYSERILPGGGLNIPGRYTDEQGLVRDGDGYICVASSDLPKGTVIETSLGMGKVYDSGCALGTIDIYTNW